MSSGKRFSISVDGVDLTPNIDTLTDAKLVTHRASLDLRSPITVTKTYPLSQPNREWLVRRMLGEFH